MPLLLYALALVGAFALGVWYREVALPMLVKRGLTAVGVVLPALLGLALLIAFR